MRTPELRSLSILALPHFAGLSCCICPADSPCSLQQQFSVVLFDHRYRLQQHTICFFNVYNTTSRQFYNSCEARALVEETLELCWVPVVAEELVLAHSLEELLSLADGKSQLNPNAPRSALLAPWSFLQS